MRLPQHFKLRLTEAIDFLKSPLGAFVLAAVGIALAVYATWFNEKNTELSVTVLLETDVVNTEYPVPDLEVIFRGERLDPVKTPLKTVFIRIWNSGENTIRNTDYDPYAPVGFTLPSGKILWLRLERASNDYLTQKIQARQVDANSVVIAPVIFEPGDSVLLKGILLQQQSAAVSVGPFGKVAGAADVTERLTIRHPAGYVQAFRTPNEDRWHLMGITALLGLLVLNLLVVLVRDWRRKLLAKRTSIQEPSNRADRR
jgi:hypothetical protein